MANSELVGNELLEAQIHVYNIIFSTMNVMSLKCAVELGIPEIIHSHGKPMTINELVATLPINQKKAPGIYRLMRLLTHSGFFAVKEVNQEEKGYALTPASLLLLKDNPFTQRSLLQIVLEPVIGMTCYLLSTWFQNDDPLPFYTAHGTTLWDFASGDSKFNQLFNETMASDTRIVANVMIQKCNTVFEGLDSVIDVGGGIGILANAIAQSFPQIQCSVFDLPHVVANLKGSGNLKFIVGNMFEGIPPANAALLKQTLHDWNDEDCVKILEKCKESINGKKGAKVIVIEIVLESQEMDYKTIQTQLFFDMEMMALADGQERTEKEWAKLFSDAGFKDYKITPMIGLRSLIEVFP